MSAQPNLAHEILSGWEQSGRLQGLITQNVDRLHQRAGQQKVIDLHGRLDEVICMSCGMVTARDHLQSWLNANNAVVDPENFVAAPDGDADLPGDDFSAIKVPACVDCHGILKPHVVFYGDSVPKMRVEEAYDWVDAADALLVVGSSLMVYSSFRFVRRAQEAGKPIAAINQGKTRADEWLSVKLQEDCGGALHRLKQYL